MTVRCVSCQHFSLKSAPTVAYLRLGLCSHEKQPGRYATALYKRECASYQRHGDEDVITKRLNYVGGEVE